MIPRVYLAGPDVFLPGPQLRASTLKAICARHGLRGISPLDLLDDEPADWSGLDEASRIARRNEAHIRGCQAVIANLTPLRGPGADSGTVYEVGFARALGLLVFGWTTHTADYAARVRALPGSTATADADGLAIEDFGLPENLMVSCGIAESGGATIAGEADHPWAGLDLFERCAAQAAARLARYSLTSIACEDANSIGRSGRPSRNSAKASRTPSR